MEKNIKGTDEVRISGNAVKSVNLSKADRSDPKKVAKLMVDIVKRQRRLWRKEIRDWQMARRQRYSVEFPRNTYMQELYDDVMLDGHLTGITENRTLRTTNKDYCFTTDGTKNEELTKLIENKSWFENTIEAAHISTYRGGLVIWAKDFSPGEIREVELVDPRRILPEQRVLLYDIDVDSGIDITSVPEVLWYAQFYSPVGLLEKAAVYTILKRHSWGSWDEFEELFGIPIRIAKVASQSDTVKNEVAGWLEEMGSAPYGVFPIGTEVEIKENSKQDAFKVFYQKIEALDKELSKLVLHQTMTTENGSSKSQGEVHESTLGEVIKADEKKMLAFLNDVLVPAMRALGYNIPEGARIEVEQTTDPKAQIEIDSKIMNGGYKLSKDYLERTYGVELDDSQPAPEPPGNDPETEDEEEEEEGPGK